MYDGLKDTYEYKLKCTACGATHDLATDVLLEDNGPPVEGSLCMCTSCGHIMQMRSGEFVSLTSEEVRKFSRTNDKRWQVLMAVQKDCRLDDPMERRRKFLQGP